MQPFDNCVHRYIFGFQNQTSPKISQAIRRFNGIFTILCPLKNANAATLNFAIAAVRLTQFSVRNSCNGPINFSKAHSSFSVGPTSTWILFLKGLKIFRYSNVREKSVIKGFAKACLKEINQ